MLVRRMVDHQFGDNPDAPVVRRGDEALDIGERAVIRVDAAIVGDVIAIVLPRRRIERQKPDRVDPKLRDIIQP